MEEDFVLFLTMLLILIFPFGFIYLILYGLNWNERKNLLLNSWFAFLAWLLSGFLVFFTYALIEHNFGRFLRELIDRKFGDFGKYAFLIFFVFSFIVINICAIAGTLYLKGSEKKVLSMTNCDDKKSEKPSIKKIWQTSAIVSILTIMMTISLFLALKDVAEKLEKENPKNKNGVTYGIYDI